MSESSRCPNCGNERSGPFCPLCGQKDQPLRQSTLYFLRHAFHEYVGIDGRLWTTMKLLLFRPGRLTSEHLAGRRRRYLAPLRLYLAATVMFFFLLSVLDPAGSLEEGIRGSLRDSTMTAGARLADIRGELDSLSVRIRNLRSRTRDTSGLDSLQSAFYSDHAVDTPPGPIPIPDSLIPTESATTLSVEEQSEGDDRLEVDVVLQRRLEFQQTVLETYPPDSTIRPGDLIDAAEILYRGRNRGIEVTGFGDQAPQRGPLFRATRARTRTEIAAALSDLARSIIERIPIVMFLMLPVFALLMKLVYVRRGWYYSEHLIFALHNHATAFIGFTVIAVLVATAGNSRWVSVSAVGILLSMNGYFLVAMKHVYDQRWAKTLVKYLLVFVTYWTVLLFLGFSLLVLLGSLLG